MCVCVCVCVGGIMFRDYGLQQGPNSGMQPAGDKNFYLWLTVEKMRAFATFTMKYLQRSD